MPAPIAPLRILLALALPMVLARATQSVMTFADALMVEHLGTQAIAASATGGFNVFLFMMLPMGTVFIVQSFVSQLVGAGDRDATPRFAWYGLIIAAVAGGVALAMIPLIDPLLGLAEFSPEVHELMAEYMVIRMFAVAAVVGVEALGTWYGGLNNTWMALAASVIAMCSDLFLNWVLIYGNLGAPEMGVNGAALSSTIGSFIGLAFLCLAFWRRWGMAIGGPAPARQRPRLSWRELRRVIRFGLPNGFNWFLEFAAFQLFVNVVLASLGDHTLAALNVVIAINSVSFMPAFGLASAGAILAGQAIGRGDKDAVWPQVKVTLYVAGTWMGAIGALYFVAPEPLLQLFDSSHSAPEFVRVGVTMLVISAAWQLFDAIAITLSETLRAAGDTTWTAGARLVLAWAVFVPTAYVVVMSYDGGPVGAMLCLIGYLALLSGAFAYRFKSGAWRKIELIEPKLV
ncbi:MAG: MATE family efflux transporter [Deltaproteobacteria bacterium]|nr:MATE family efflux transporter [Deltaproteobacteria bacterium]